VAVRSVRRRAAASLVLVTTLAAATGVAVASSRSAPERPARTQLRTFSGLVSAIAPVGRRDAWLTGTTFSSRVFVQHWAGARWRAVSTPRAMFTDGTVAIGASPAASAWVFTLVRPAAAASYSVGWQWTGHAWRSYRLAAGSSIGATTAFSRSDVWAFGTIGNGRPYVIRYDGRNWRRVRAPVQPLAVSAPNRHDLWIAGPAPEASPVTYAAAQWNGTSWRSLKLPRLRVPKGMHASWPQLLATSRADAWIDFDLLGNRAQGPEGQALLHYHAGRWTQVSVPPGSLFRSSNLISDGVGGVLLALAAPHGLGSAVYDYRNGSWSRTAVFAARGRDTIILSIARVPGTGQAWAGGYALHTRGATHPYGVLYQFRR
jgi:hypothetical protein